MRYNRAMQIGRFRFKFPARRVWRLSAALLVLLFVLVQEYPGYGTDDARLARVLRGRAFDFWSWEFAALQAKLAQNTAGTQAWLSESERHDLVTGYFKLLGEIEQADRDLEDYYTHAGAQPDPAHAAELRANLDQLRAREAAEQPLVEGILEEQISAVLTDWGFGAPGEVFPPVSMHFTPLPQMLVVSRRDRIETLYQVSLEHGIPVDEQEALEGQSDRLLDARSLVVPIGGLAMYPSMLLESSAQSWVVEATSHEWTHHWLFLRPLGYNYDSASDTRSINETVASIAGQEIGDEVLRRYYPELVPQGGGGVLGAPLRQDGFDYGKELNDTRVHVDELLARGEIDTAERYMEARRQIFVYHGYAIRKMNQAYFAFYGGYQAQPGGAAGEDPIGPAVRELRARTPSLKAFLDAVAGVTTLDELKAVLAQWPAR
jgi:hypothetical protein